MLAGNPRSDLSILIACLPRDPTGYPGPKEVVPADRPERVQQLPTQVQPGRTPAFQTGRVHLVQRNPTPGHLGDPVTLMT